MGLLDTLPVVVRQCSSSEHTCPVCLERYDEGNRNENAEGDEVRSLSSSGGGSSNSNCGRHRTKVITPCGHAFCYDCITAVCAVGDQGTCPMCRASVEMTALRRVQAPRAAVAMAMANSGGDEDWF